MQPRVSVVIPAFNRISVIERALRSVITQTFSDIEILVVDDGSTDGTAEKAAEVGLRDSRVRIIHYSPNRGAQHARNVGIKASRGNWIAFLDSDDWYLPQSIAWRMNVAKNAAAECVYTNCLKITEGRQEKWELSGVSGHIYKDMLAAPGPMFQSLLVTKKAVQEIGFLDESIVAFQEWDTAIRLALNRKFAFLSEPTFVYDYTTPVAISRSAARAAKGYQQIVEKNSNAILAEVGRRTMCRHLVKILLYHRAAHGLRGVVKGAKNLSGPLVDFRAFVLFAAAVVSVQHFLKCCYHPRRFNLSNVAKKGPDKIDKIINMFNRIC